MARTVKDIMNAELLSIPVGARADETLAMILEYGVTAVPVLDGAGRPIGVTSLRDLIGRGRDEAPMTSPATTVAMSASVESAAETMATTNRHHLVVVGSDGKAVGMLSTLDVLRALVGQPSSHPPAFPHYDTELAMAWSDDEDLASSSRALLTPEAPGVLVLVHGGIGRDEVTVWAEAPENLRARVDQLATDRAAYPELARVLHTGRLRFRYAVVHDASARRGLLERVHRRISSAPPPGAN